MYLLRSLAIVLSSLSLLSARDHGSLFDEDKEVKSRGFHTCRKNGNLSLTFGGNSLKHARPILRELKKFDDIKATFFVNGRSLRPKSTGYHRTNKKYLATLAKKGHIIGISAWNPDADFLEGKPKKILANVRKSAKMIEKVIGVRPKYVHVSKGKVSKKVYKLLTSKGYYLIGWNTSPKQKKSIKKFVKRSSRAKSYISYFPDGSEAKKGLKKYLKEVEKKKYAFVSLKKCIGSDKKPYRERDSEEAATSTD